MFHVYRLKPWKDRVLSGLAGWLQKRGVNANVITGIGLISGLLAGGMIFLHQVGSGIILIILSIIADLLDGTVARLGPVLTLTGKYFDAISDRVVELVWVGAMIYTGILPGWGWLLPLGSVLLLLTRSWSYHNGQDSTNVPVARFERMVAIIGMLALPWRWLTMGIYLLVTAGTFISGMIIVKSLLTSKKPMVSLSSTKSLS